MLLALFSNRNQNGRSLLFGVGVGVNFTVAAIGKSRRNDARGYLEILIKMFKPTKKQRSIRQRALTSVWNTDKWVIPRSLVKAVDDENWKLADKILDKIKKAWPNDPEVTYYDSMIYSTRVINDMVRKKEI